MSPGTATALMTGMAAITIASTALMATLAGSAPQPRAKSTTAPLPESVDPRNAAERWTRAGLVAAPPRRKGYRFAATLTARNAMIFRGMAPDEAIRARLLDTITALAPSFDTRGRITIDPAMPDPRWPELVERALGALALMRTGTLSVRDLSVALDGAVDDERDLRRLMVRVQPDWTVNVDAPEPASLTTFAIEIAPDGSATARGRLPPGLTVEEVRAALPEVQIDDGIVGSRLHGDSEGWDGALAAIAAALPRLSDGSILIGDGLIDMQGRLRRGFSRQSTHAALRAMTPTGWRLDYHVQETPPPSQATLELTTTGIRLRGMVPAGTDLPDFRRDIDAGQTKFGGGGDPERWTAAVSAAGQLLGVMLDGRVRIATNKIETAGRLMPGHSPDEIEAWLSRATDGYWDIDLSKVVATDPAEGMVRTDPETGARQELRAGQWMAIKSKPGTEPDCIAATEAIERERGIRFLAGSRRVAPSAVEALDRLADLATKCLASSPSARLEIGGHTDSVGSVTQNQALSEARARAVRAALIERGVPAAGLVAQGYGESQPIANNDTEAGRARNRRISLRWRNLEARQSAGRVATTTATAHAD